MIKGLALATMAFWCLAGTAFAQVPLPCPFAATPQEKIVCADPGLTKLREQLEARYLQATAQLSQQGQDMLGNNLNAWRKYVSVVCAKTMTSDQKQCLRHVYEEQLQIVSHAAKRIGPYPFTQLQQFHVQQNFDTTPGRK
ncbi:MAG TPA: hypothetical protein VHX39_03905 [Acetobacteraceae bacterium]|jgi:uncharacterized protein|nr:hypothetical protein [Acetobacteraceae bacterium]